MLIRSLIAGWILLSVSYAQHAYPPFSMADSLRGTLNADRSSFDVQFYDLKVEVDIPGQSIAGSNTITFKVLQPMDRMQLDLNRDMEVKMVEAKGRRLTFSRIHDALLVNFDERLLRGERHEVTVHYAGKPKVSKNPPWAGGFVWKKDREGKDWVAVACEGDGASLWWPLKDHLSDEPDSMAISITCPSDLMAVSNGNLRSKTNLPNSKTQYDWFVSYPINSYNVTLNIGDYIRLGDIYVSGQDTLQLDYYVFARNQIRAREHFVQVGPMLEAFEHYFGPYPFWKDGYAMVETPYWGMEHQSAIAYGNHFKNNAYDFDFIIVHESAHEYWGNSISCPDHAELWIHEAFGTYAEALLVEYQKGEQKALEYINKNKKRVLNLQPVVGPLGVNYHRDQDGDMYFKGSLMLNTLRYAIQDDKAWFKAIKDLTTNRAISIVNTQQIIDHFDGYTTLPLRPIFGQYLFHTAIPKLELDLRKKGRNLIVRYRWVTDVANFSMPVKVSTSTETYDWIPATNEWKEIQVPSMKPEQFKVDTDVAFIRVD
jgi:aminopeptidase N